MKAVSIPLKTLPPLIEQGGHFALGMLTPLTLEYQLFDAELFGSIPF